MAYSFGSGATDKLQNTTGRAAQLLSTNRSVYARIRVNAAAAANRDILNIWSPGILWHAYCGFSNTGTNLWFWGYEDSGFGFHTVSWTTGFAAGSEHVVVCTFDGANLKIFADTDGSPKATLASTAAVLTGSAPTLLVGNHPSSTTQSFNGWIKELAWFNYALPPRLIMELGAGRSPMRLPVKPVSYFDFRKDALDRGPARLHLAPTGAALVPHERILYRPARNRWLRRVDAPAGGGGRTLSGTSSVPAFTSAAAAKALVKLSSSKSIGAVGSTAAAKVLAKLSASQQIAAFTSSGTLSGGSRVLTASQQIAAFTSAAAAKVIAKLSAAQQISAFTSTAALDRIAKLTGVSAVPAFTSSAAVERVAKIAATSAIGNFASSAVLRDPNAQVVSSLYPGVRRRTRR